MKKICCLIIGIVLMMAMLPGCGGQSGDSAADAEAVETTTDESQSAAGQQTSDQTADDQQTAGDQQAADQSAGGEAEAVDISTLGGDGVDVDLTKLSSTMVYSVVNDMMVKQNDYIGKKIRMCGTMSTYHDQDTGNTYYACIIMDATACCSQGVEFQTTDEFDPADYPKDGEIVTVSGTYDTYEDDGYKYAVLRDAVLE